MADLEDVTLDGRPLQSLRVADLKAALEERGLSKSGQKNALIKRLKGALMLENLQKTSTAHVGLQPNSQIGEEMSQNSFIKQYLAKQQELLRQRLEREAREAYETNDQEDHSDVNNSICPPQVPDASSAVTDHFKPPGPSSGQAMPAGLSHRHQEAAMSRPLASVSMAQGRSEAAADSDEEESEDGEDDGDGDDDEDWENNIQRRLPRQPVRAPMARERSAASCQPQQQHIPSVLSPQLRQPTPPPSPPPELSFPLPDTPKQSPPSPDVAAGVRSPSSSSSGSSSSGSRSSSPEPHSGHAERKPGPLTLLARKMESEGAFSGAEWHCRDANRQDICSSSAFPNKVRPEGLVSPVPHMLSASHAPIKLGTNQGHAQVPVLKPTAERDAELERDKSLELQRQAQKKKHEQEQAMEEERVRAALEREQQKALEKEQFEREQALERERLERELALAREKEEKEQALALERQRAREKELAMQKEQEEHERRQKEEQEKALELERARILEREKALEKERLEREQALEAERIERERMEREKALELERLEKERLEKEAALERERLEREKERMEREKALEQERLERERAEQLRALERERIEKEKALEQERIERERVLELKRIEQERLEKEKALEQERIEREKALEQERIEREKALEQERIEREKALERERIEREKALEQERIEREKAIEQERIEREKALEQQRLEREKALEKERIEQERIKREKALEQERIEREKLEREKALEMERIEREKALEKERIEREKIEKEKALERERIELEKALERERIEKERIEREKSERERALELERRERERALEQQRLELEKQENERIERERALEQERIKREKAKDQEEKAEREAALERERLEKAEQVRVELEKAQELKRQVLNDERKAQENALELQKERIGEQDSVEKKQATQKENTAHERANDSRMADVKSEDHLTPSRGCEIGFVPLPTPPPLSTGTSRKASTEADKQEGEVHGPVTCEGQTEESNTPKSPQPVFKKFRFTRETPQATSRVIKRPRTFSDTPQPSASVMTALNADGQRQKQQSADLKDVTEQLNQVEAVESAKKGDAIKITSKKNQELDRNEAAVKESILTAIDDQVMSPSSTVGASERARNVTKLEKQDLRRSSSNDSSSSESDTASSSSPSTDSSSSSRQKTYTSRLSKDEENASPQRLEVGTVQKTSPAKMEISSAITQINEGLLTKLNEASTQDDLQTRKDSEDDEEKPEQSCDGDAAVSEPEKGMETNNETPKAFSARKISLSSSKSSPGSTDEHELGTAGGRKRRWGSSTAVTAKKTSISITTDSLKSLIPDIRPALNQEAVMELHPEEPVLSETEEEEKDHADQELQIRRTVTQIVHVENQDDGQKEAKRRREESEEEDMLDEKDMKTSDEDPTYTRAIETPSPLHTRHETDANSVTQSDILIRRSISQQKTGVSITIDDPVRTARQPSPPRGNVSNIVHVCNLVRPFTLGQLKELLGRTGTLVEDGFWIDKIKSHCYVTYSSSEEAVATRAALHGVKWPQSNPKVLSVDFCQQDELDFHKNLGSGDRVGIGGSSHVRNLPSLLPDRDQWVEREREMERRERARTEREWDRDKVREFGKASEQREAGARRSRSRDRRHKEREKSNEKKTEKKEKTEDPPAKLLDDLFRKTKAVPCIYWLPLTEEQYLQREAARVERRKEREMQRKKEAEEAELKKKEENKERMKPAGGVTVDRSESEKIRDRDRARDRGRDREREREVDKRRDGYRRPGVGPAPSGRRSRSRSDPRERRR